MKKLFLFMLCLFFVAGSAQAKQEGQLWQAGESSIYFYDVEPGDTHGDGKLMIDLDKHTFVFNGQGFVPSARMTLQARAADSTDFVVFAKGKVTPSGNLHIEGKWEAAAAPATVLIDYQGIFGYWLENNGLFTAKISYLYSTDGGTTWSKTSNSDAIYGDCDDIVYYTELGVPENALVKLKAVVVWGDDKTASEVFQVRWNAAQYYAYYKIDGTTQNTKLSYVGTLQWVDYP